MVWGLAFSGQRSAFSFQLLRWKLVEGRGSGVSDQLLGGSLAGSAVWVLAFSDQLSAASSQRSVISNQIYGKKEAR